MTADTVNPSSSLLDEAPAMMIAFEGDAVQVPAAVIAYGSRNADGSITDAQRGIDKPLRERGEGG